MDAVGRIKISNSLIANNITGCFLQKALELSPSVVKVNIGNQVKEETFTDSYGYKNIKNYTCLKCKGKPNFLYKSSLANHCLKVHNIDINSNKGIGSFSNEYNLVKVHYCKICKKEYLSENSFRIHLNNVHMIRSSFKNGKLLLIGDADAFIIKQCDACCKKFDTEEDRIDHLNNYNHLKYFRCYYPDCNATYSYYRTIKDHYLNCHGERIQYSKDQFCLAYNLYKEMQGAQGNPNADKTTIDTYNPINTGFHTSIPHSINDDNSTFVNSYSTPANNHYEPPQINTDFLFTNLGRTSENNLIPSISWGNNPIGSITANTSFTSAASNNYSTSKASQTSATPIGISDNFVEGVEFGDNFLDSIEAENGSVALTEDDLDLINTVSNYSNTPSSISDGNIISSSWGDDFMNNTLDGN